MAETIEEWAEQRAHELDDDGWEWARSFFPDDRTTFHVMLGGHGERLPSGASVHAAKAALLAVRDRLVDGLRAAVYPDVRRAALAALAMPSVSQLGVGPHHRALARDRLVSIGDRCPHTGAYWVEITNLGRECARVLRIREGK